MRHVICFGNELHGDDGFGPAVCRRLAAEPVPAGWRVFEAGSRGLDAIVLFEGCREAIVVDAAAPAGRPGRLSEPRPAEIDESVAAHGHGAGVAYLLRALAALQDAPPRVRIVAAEMATLTPFRPGLSAPVALAVEEAVALLRRQMETMEDA